MFIYDGKKLPVGVEFVIGTSKYGSDWLLKAMPEELAEVGITVVEDPIRPDDRFYWVTENPDGTFTAIAKDLDMLKTMITEQISDTAWKMLMPTDYMDSRKANDADYVAPADWLTWRAAVRSQADDAISTVKGCRKIETLITASQVQWEQDPKQKAKLAAK